MSSSFISVPQRPCSGPCVAPGVIGFGRWCDDTRGLLTAIVELRSKAMFLAVLCFDAFPVSAGFRFRLRGHYIGVFRCVAQLFEV